MTITMTSKNLKSKIQNLTVSPSLLFLLQLGTVLTVMTKKCGIHRCEAPIYSAFLGGLCQVMLLSFTGIILTTASANASLARIISIDGDVELQRDGWDSFQRALPGTALYGPDLLQPERGSRIEVMCPNWRTRWLVPAGTISAVNNGCPGTPARLKPQFGVGDLNGGSDPSIPYVITPRSGVVLTPRPNLRWNPVDGATHYTVSLMARDEILWQMETDQTQLDYPDDQPALMPSRLYTVTVVADTGASSADEGLSLRFNRLPDEQAATVQADIDVINALDIPEEVKTLMRVEDIYPNYQLIASALNDLEHVIASGIETAQVYRLLGDIYLKSGLRLLAEKSYVEALAVATTSNRLEEEVLAQLGLGTLYQQIGETERALEQLRCAQNGATELGDEQLMESIDDALAGL